MTTLQAIRGMNDVLPAEAVRWQHVEDSARRVFTTYGYSEIRLPLVEKTELYTRTIGQATDIVEKEMYTFTDRNGDSLTLRPEGTAGCVRAAIEHGLTYNQLQRLWYRGPMFRHERPQAGRYRQFHQIGVETFGLAGPESDAELILMTARLWRILGLRELRLEINSLGDPAARARYREHLVDYLSAHLDVLDDDSRRRLHANPLRILDSKNPALAEIIANAPRLLDYLDDEARHHFAQVSALLTQAGLPHTINPRLVRGLDYYTKTVFEWVTDHLGAQGTVCAGGRYDGLVAQLGGHATHAAGCALGVERVVALLPEAACAIDCPHVFLACVGESAQRYALPLAERLRDALPDLRLLANGGGGGFKNQMKRADKSGAALALIIGDDEALNQRVTVKYLRADHPQQHCNEAELIELLAQHINGEV